MRAVFVRRLERHGLERQGCAKPPKTPFKPTRRPLWAFPYLRTSRHLRPLLTYPRARSPARGSRPTSPKPRSTNQTPRHGDPLPVAFAVYRRILTRRPPLRNGV